MKPFYLLPLIVALALPLRAAEEDSKPPKPAAPKTVVQSKIRSASPKQNGHEKWIGAVTMPVPEMVRAQLPNLPEGQGAAVVMVAKESPAMAAGLERFDIIVRADGQPISSQQDLQQILNKRNFGTQARLELIRKGAAKQLYVIVLEKPEGEPGGGGGPGGRGGIFGSNMRPENVSIQFTFTDASGKQQTIGAPTLAAFGQKARDDEAFRNQMQQMFQGLQQNPQGITIRLRPAQNEPATPPPNPQP
ncbi:MAG: PDZ domain-containing protein [Verrucomicrobia bacterium]|nr:PDZ domain-containing protein [Verrucomicrobiota bacterium]